jgi:hypothetical protein
MKPREKGEPLPPRQEPSGRRLFWPLAVAVALVAWAGGVGAADLVIRIPGDLSQQDGFYRLDYRDVNSRKIRYKNISYSLEVIGNVTGVKGANVDSVLLFLNAVANTTGSNAHMYITGTYYRPSV